jgi:hypothetical protein
MSLSAIEAALEKASEPIDLFFRDDDAGWAMDELEAMVELFAEHRCPVDLAIIPAALDSAKAARLLGWRDAFPLISFHQHGYTHLNHEPAGERKCEFGRARAIDQQRSDIVLGQQMLFDFLGRVDSIFTPPWNRLLAETAQCLADLGFALLSCDCSAGRGGARGEPPALPVTIDWDKERRRDRAGALRAVAAAIESEVRPIGIMMHHATLDGPQLDKLAELIHFLVTSPKVRLRPMRDWI